MNLHQPSRNYQKLMPEKNVEIQRTMMKGKLPKEEEVVRTHIVEEDITLMKKRQRIGRANIPQIRVMEVPV